MAIAELRVVEVHFRRESHAFSLSEFPAVVGMFFLPVNEYLVAVGLGPESHSRSGHGSR